MEQEEVHRRATEKEGEDKRKEKQESQNHSKGIEGVSPLLGFGRWGFVVLECHVLAPHSPLEVSKITLYIHIIAGMRL